MAKDSTSSETVQGAPASAPHADNYVTLIATDRSGQKRPLRVEHISIVAGGELLARDFVSQRRMALLEAGYVTRASVWRAHPALPYPAIGEA